MLGFVAVCCGFSYLLRKIEKTTELSGWPRRPVRPVYSKLLPMMLFNLVLGLSQAFFVQCMLSNNNDKYNNKQTSLKRTNSRTNSEASSVTIDLRGKFCMGGWY